MELIERYVYAVVSKLPEKGRTEIEKEIKALIYDMMDSYGEEMSEEEKINKVLKELGDPESLADNYRDKKRYLIGPTYFTKYIYVLKIVSWAVFFGVTVATVVGLIFDQPISVGAIIGEYMATLFSGIIQGAAWVTGVFAVIEYTGTDIKELTGDKKGWDPTKLPEIPNKKTYIKPSESIFGIIFTTIFFIILYFVPQYIAMYRITSGERMITPVFNLETLSTLKLLIISMFVAGISRELVKLIFGKWTVQSAIIYATLSVLSAMLLIVFVLNPTIWNDDFLTQLSTIFKGEIPFRESWDYVINGFVFVVAVVTIIDIFVPMYKGVKYGSK
ncbi:MAG: hypothetical protein ACI35O_01825 [Bacillaceae bacterium]